MRFFNVRAIILRVCVISILGAFVYPFLPAKQQWQIEAALGSSEADSLREVIFLTINGIAAGLKNTG